MSSVTSRPPSKTERCHVYIYDEEDTPQRYPLRRLLDSVIEHVGPDQQRWQVAGVWGQGFKTARLGDLTSPSPEDETPVDTAALVDLDDDPDEWFYDIVIRTPDRSLTFGIFDSSYMFVDGPRDQVLAIVRDFDDVKESDFDFDGNPIRSAPGEA